MTEEVKDINEEVVEPNVEEETKEVKEKSFSEAELKKLMNEEKRRLSKELGVNLFEKDAIQKNKDLIDSLKTDAEKEAERVKAMEEKLNAFEAEKSNWEFEKTAMEIGIDLEHKDDINALMSTIKDEEMSLSDKLEQLVEKYPQFKKEIPAAAQNKETQEQPGIIQLGMDLNHNTQTMKSDLEKYLDEQYKDNPYYKKRG